MKRKGQLEEMKQIRYIFLTWEKMGNSTFFDKVKGGNIALFYKTHIIRRAIFLLFSSSLDDFVSCNLQCVHACSPYD